MGEGAPRLDGVRFGVLALGDTAYAEFCAIGRAIDIRLEALGATRAVDRLDLDLDFAKPAAAWIKGALGTLAPAQAAAEPRPDNVVAVDFGRAGGETAEPSRDPVVAEVVDHINLNSSRSAKETIHLALGFEDGTPAYEPGDSLELYPENDPALVDDILAAAGLASDEALRTALVAERDVTTLSPAAIERFVAATGHAEARRLLEAGEARAWIEGRHLVDLLETYPAALTAEHLSGITRPLPPRAYSIASSRREVGEEAHLLIAAVRYATHGRGRTGVASTHVADRVRNGAKLKVRLKPNRHFRLPADPATDIVMIGPGTGVAPFRAFVQDRRATGATGRNWLFFGDRTFTHDFLYQTEWQEALEDGSLTRMDLAFSRDQPEKNLCAGPPVRPAARPRRLDRGRRQPVCLRRCQADGQGRAGRPGPVVRRRAGAVPREGGGGRARAREGQALPAGRVLTPLPLFRGSRSENPEPMDERARSGNSLRGAISGSRVRAASLRAAARPG